MRWDSTKTSFNNCALPIVRSFYPIVTASIERCSILVQLVSVDWSIADVEIWLAAFIPNGVVNDLDSEYYACRLSIKVSKTFSVTNLIVLLSFCSIVFLASTVLIAIYSKFQFFCWLWYNFFARVYNIICLIVVERGIIIFLNILLTPILFLL